MPNGLAVDRRGRILIAEYEHGTLRRFDPASGTTEIILSEVESRKTARANYPAIDREGRIWCTSSTAMKDDLAALRTKADDGFVFVFGRRWQQVESLRKGLHFANGLAFSKRFQVALHCGKLHTPGLFERPSLLVVGLGLSRISDRNWRPLQTV